MSNIIFVSKEKGKLYSNNQNPKSSFCAFDVSSYSKKPFKHLSPFTFSRKFEIPVPGMENVYAHSVESIWQGLKIIDGVIDDAMFQEKPRKRKGNVEGHQFGRERLNLVDARWKIYVPSYHYYLDNFAPTEALDEILEQQRIGKNVFLYDVEENGNINKPEPLAHASVLATYLNLQIHNQRTKPINGEELRLLLILENDETIEKKVKDILPYLDCPEFKKAVQYHCFEHPENPDRYRISKALGGLIK